MGLQIIKPNTRIDFIGFRRIAFLISALVIAVGIVSLVGKGGPRYGIDFAGGIIIQAKVHAEEHLDVRDVQDAMKAVELPGLVVQEILNEKNEFLIRTSASDVDTEVVRNQVMENVSSAFNGAEVEVRRTEMVGPKVSDDLRTKALEALFYAVLLIAIYISGRFEQRWMAAAIMAGGLFAGITALQFLGLSITFLIFGALAITLGLCWYLKLNYALGAVAALLHDVMITVGVFSLLDKEFDLTIIAALLTIIGYSLNDTIIVFDRIRENIKGQSDEHLKDIINISVNQTLSRTILTSGTTLLVVAALFIFGGGAIHDFALALLVGIFVGTYSSVFVASPVLLGFGPTMPADAPKEAAA
ncbi:preprotein translocase subunit SecF [Paucidesulfovibrio gracilis DSM 16080]|uniref:Protein-export membrane protein SecF n=1 Tax=Paucidesulfovibrio gracilis DSM 16080 TaxID=1121449 RepID=A0A1T4WMW6_9BACT|nr:protein translocase subunit SecF [Paucidesulfovibrio gracilis]SKA78674.1 preprotein translocase subunit SecF [Paucidesulfovibrio gracilis DSM 16080]